MENPRKLPLEGIRVLEFGHMVMGPSCGLILADMGAEVIKIEPQGEGDKTRHLDSFGSGFHCTYNRNKKSLSIDIKSNESHALITQLIRSADVFTENFREGALTKQGLGYEAVTKINPKIIYCSMKGFLSGPYQHRAALDEVVQMMGGLAYMTGPPGQPSRAGASVNDIMGGMFGAIGILAALHERHSSGQGSVVKSGLFENCALLMAQHIASFERTEKPSKSLFVRDSQPWPVYDLFDIKDEKQIFIGLVTEGQWLKFCAEFSLQDLQQNPQLQCNADRVKNRETLILPRLKTMIADYAMEDMISRLEKTGCPYAPVAKPEDLLDDVHMQQSHGFVDTELQQGKIGKIPALPLQYNHQRLPLRRQPPLVGEHSREILYSLGQTEQEVNTLIEKGILTETPRVLLQDSAVSDNMP